MWKALNSIPGRNRGRKGGRKEGKKEGRKDLALARYTNVIMNAESYYVYFLK